VVMGRAKNGEAIRPIRRTPKAQRNLRKLMERAQAEGDLATWRRTKAVLEYMGGRCVEGLASFLEVDRSSVSRWLIWYDVTGPEGLLTKKAPGAPPRLTPPQRDELVGLIEAGPVAAGFHTGLWTGPMIGELIRNRYGVSYHNHHIPRLLHQLGFSVQRPRKRLARADKEAQARWLKERLPAVKKRPPHAGASSCSAMK
jgi:transposase